MRSSFLKTLAACALLLVPATAMAQRTVIIDTTIRAGIPDILNGIVNVMLFWAMPLATVLFLIGAFMLVASGGNDTTKDKAKKIMEASLVGLAIILSSWMILSTVVYLLAA